MILPGKGKTVMRWLICSAWLAMLMACPVVESAEPEENAGRETASKSPDVAGIEKDVIVAKTCPS